MVGIYKTLGTKITFRIENIAFCFTPPTVNKLNSLEIGATQFSIKFNDSLRYFHQSENMHHLMFVNSYQQHDDAT